MNILNMRLKMKNLNLDEDEYAEVMTVYFEYYECSKHVIAQFRVPASGD